MVAPPAVKKKGTTKRILIEVISLPSWTQDHSSFWQIYLM
jgi:hypothetical protein